MESVTSFMNRNGKNGLFAVYERDEEVRASTGRRNKVKNTDLAHHALLYGENDEEEED